MISIVPKSEPQPADALSEQASKVSQEEKERMKIDRDFWSQCVHYMVDEETIGETAARRVIEAADTLLRARRDRFPL